MKRKAFAHVLLLFAQRYLIFDGGISRNRCTKFTGRKKVGHECHSLPKKLIKTLVERIELSNKRIHALDLLKFLSNCTYSFVQ